MAEWPKWEDLWSFGKFDLSLSTQEFWQLTFREYRSLSKRWDENQNILDHRTGTLASIIANSTRTSKDDKVFVPVDFFPSLKRFYKKSSNDSGVPGDDRKIKSLQSVEEQISIMEMWTTLYRAEAIVNKG